MSIVAINQCYFAQILEVLTNLLPCLAFLSPPTSELDFNKKMVNLNELNYYLSRRLLLLNKVDPGAPIPMEHLTEQFERPSGFERMLQWIGGDNRELDPNKMDHELHTSTHILLDDEKVLMAFKAGRDTTLFTNLRFLSLDVKSILNKSKVQYTSIPYKVGLSHR